MGKDKREREKQLVRQMIGLYQKKNQDIDCESLENYAIQRIEKCPYMESKTFCSSCKTHCYQKQKREEIRKVMRYAGPRMLLRAPNLVIKHIFDTWKSIQQKKQTN